MCVCGKPLAVNESGVGQEVECPDCGKILVIPRPAIEWACSCGAPILIPANLSLFAESITCVECNAIHKVPEVEEPEEAQTEESEIAPEPESSPAVETRIPLADRPPESESLSFIPPATCPSCKAPTRAGHVICINCGLNLKTGKQMKTEDEEEEV